MVKEAMCCMNIKFFFKQAKGKRVREKPDAFRSCRRTLWVIEDLLHVRDVEQERITQHLEYQEAQLRVQLQNEELMMTSEGKCTRNPRK